jgi:hypothetical protein
MFKSVLGAVDMFGYALTSVYTANFIVTDAASSSFCLSSFNSNTRPIIHIAEDRVIRKPVKQTQVGNSISNFSSQFRIPERKRVSKETR